MFIEIFIGPDSIPTRDLCTSHLFTWISRILPVFKWVWSLKVCVELFITWWDTFFQYFSLFLFCFSWHLKFWEFLNINFGKIQSFIESVDLMCVKDTWALPFFNLRQSLVLLLPVACTHYQVTKTTREGIGTGPSYILVVVL